MYKQYNYIHYEKCPNERLSTCNVVILKNVTALMTVPAGDKQGPNLCLIHGAEKLQVSFLLISMANSQSCFLCKAVPSTFFFKKARQGSALSVSGVFHHLL